MPKTSFARLSPLAKGRIVGLREAGKERTEIQQMVKKKNGKPPSPQSVDSVLQRFKSDPEWDGCQDRAAGGRPRDLSAQQEAKMQKILVRDVAASPSRQKSARVLRTTRCSTLATRIP